MGFGGFFWGRVGQDLGFGIWDLGFGFQGEWKGYQSSPRKYKWGGGGAGLRVGLEGFWIWFLVGTAGRGISCRQGTLKEGL